jgi:hydroxylamine reductase (hybrid-cluster protein)
MPRFRVRDLMINVGEGSGGICEIITNCGGVTELCVENTQGCAFTVDCNCTIQTCGANSCGVCTPFATVGCGCSYCSYCTACSLGVTVQCRVHSICGRTVVCTPTFDTLTVQGMQVEHLTALKEELRKTLERMEAQEKSIKERQMPQTIEQVDQAEKKLNEGLEALKHRRSELQKRGE